MPDISLDLLGLGELEADLQRLSRSLANKAVRDAVMAGAKLARDKTRQSAPVRSGKLKKNIVFHYQKKLLHYLNQFRLIQNHKATFFLPLVVVACFQICL